MIEMLIRINNSNNSINIKNLMKWLIRDMMKKNLFYKWIRIMNMMIIIDFYSFLFLALFFILFWFSFLY
jgi:hypothetical protein